MSTAIETLKLWREDPAQFVRDNFNVEPDLWQLRALSAFASQDSKLMRICLSACAGPQPGKSAVLAWCGWHFLSTQGDVGDHPKGAAVSMTWDNLKDNLWAELSKWQQRSAWLTKYFTWTKERIFQKQFPETWFLSARSWSKSSNEEEQGRVLSGIHSGYVLFLIDESGDIPVAVMKAAEQAMGNVKFGKILQAGNPTSQDGMLYAAQTTQAERWFTIRITGDPDDPERSPRIDIEWARSQIKLYGIKDPWVMAYILGQFPESGINTLITVNEIDLAMKRGIKLEQYEHAQKRLGVDVARFGLDSTIIYPRQGLRSFKYIEMRGARNNEIAARVMLNKAKWGSEREYIDGTGGFGGGVIDNLITAGFSPQEIHFSGKATNPQYYNKRTEMWFNLRDWIRRGGVIVDDPILRKELAAPTYSFKDGKLLLEPKEKIKERLGFSPDRADALCLTFAEADMPKSILDVLGISNQHQGKAKIDYDPLDQML